MGILFKTVDDWINKHRAWSLLATVIITVTMVALINWLTGSDLFRQFFYPKRCVPTSPKTCDPLEWKVLFQATVLILGLPIAFLLWHWRDRNVRDQIGESGKQVENQRKDINLKEFQEVQLRAAGALDANFSPEAREQLQIAALHQLRYFLQADQPVSFREAALELLLSGHAIAMNVCKTSALHSVDPSILKGQIQQIRDEFDVITLARMKVIESEVETIFNSNFPLNGRNFDLLSFKIPETKLPLMLIDCSFVGADLRDSSLRHSFFTRSNLAGALLWSADLSCAWFGCSDLSGTQFCGADLAEARFDDAKITASDFRGSNWDQAFFYDAFYDDDTKLCKWFDRNGEIHWHSLKTTTVRRLRSKLVNLGAKGLTEILKAK
jgi:Pentapeptide repeats (8 copies)